MYYNKLKYLMAFLLPLLLLLSACGNETDPNPTLDEKKVERYVELVPERLGLVVLKKSQNDKPPPDETPVIQTVPIVGRNVPIRIRYVGITQPRASVIVEARVSGLIKSYHGEMGENVTKGMVLARIDPVDYELSLKEALANLELVRAQYEALGKSYTRIKELLPRKAVPQERLDTVKGEYLAAKAGVARMESVVKITEERLKKTRITCPLDGWVSQRFVEVGTNVEPGEPLFKIVDLSVIKLIIYVTEKDYGYLQKGQKVDLTVDAYSKRRFSGHIHRLAVEADAKTNTFEVEIQVANPEGLLKAGMSAHVVLVREILQNAIFIPQSAVLYREKGPCVFILDDETGVAREQEVTLGAASGDQIQVLSGLHNSSTLVVKGQHYIKNGSKPKVLP